MQEPHQIYSILRQFPVPKMVKLQEDILLKRNRDSGVEVQQFVAEEVVILGL